MKKYILSIVILCLLSGVVLSQANTQGMTIDNLNVRSGPGTEHAVIHKILARTDVIIEARNDIGNWVIIHTADQAIRGWVASRYIVWDADIALGNMPVSTEVFESPAPQQAITMPVQPVNSYQNTGELAARLLATPMLYNMNNDLLHSIYSRGRGRGNNPNVFMKIGDSVSATQPFLSAYGSGTENYNLGPYQHLQETIHFFSSASFERESYASQSGFASGAIFDPTWVDTRLCSGTPLNCEYRAMRPSVAIILLGTADVQRRLDQDEFRSNMNTLVTDLISWGVIPVLTTIPRNPEWLWDDGLVFNNIILDIGQQHNIPIINLWLAVLNLPYNGMDPDLYHLSESAQANPFNFTGEEALYGVNLRNLLTLQALDELRQNVLR